VGLIDVGNPGIDGNPGIVGTVNDGQVPLQELVVVVGTGVVVVGASVVVVGASVVVVIIVVNVVTVVGHSG
jgi:hypothetical protein